MSVSCDEAGNVKVVLDCGKVWVFTSVEWERASWGLPLDATLSDIADAMCCDCGKWEYCSFHLRKFKRS